MIIIRKSPEQKAFESLLPELSLARLLRRTIRKAISALVTEGNNGFS
jgi:hypothetical protein